MVDFVDVYLFGITKFDIYYLCHQLAFLTQPHTLPTSGTGLPGAALPLASYPGWGHRSAMEVAPFDRLCSFYSESVASIR